MPSLFATKPRCPRRFVVAKGQNLLAEKIKQLARDTGIMLVENKSLAQALYKSVEVGDSIPAKLYQAVAEILAMVFRAEAEVRKAEAAQEAPETLLVRRLKMVRFRRRGWLDDSTPAGRTT